MLWKWCNILCFLLGSPPITTFFCGELFHQKCSVCMILDVTLLYVLSGILDDLKLVSLLHMKKIF